MRRKARSTITVYVLETEPRKQTWVDFARFGILEEDVVMKKLCCFSNIVTT